MCSSNIEVSFRAVGILAYLCSDSEGYWFKTSIDIKTILDEIVGVSEKLN
jgi:hypothetical protein